MNRLLKDGAALASACAVTIATTSAAWAEPEKTDIKVTAFTGSLVTLIERVAVWEGFLEKEGLNASFVEVTNGPAMIASVLGGSADFTATAPIFAWNLYEKGECLSMFGAEIGSFYSFIAGEGVDLPNLDKGFPDSVRDLKGKRIGVVGRGTATEQWASTVLSDAGLDPEKDVTFVATGGMTTALPALENGMVDALFSFPPNENNLEPGTFTVVARLFDSEVPSLAKMIQAGPVSTCDFKQEYPQTQAAYCRAWHAAYDFTLDPANTKAMEGVVSKIMGVDDAAANDIWETYKGALIGPLWTEETWAAQAKYLPLVDGKPMSPPPFADMIDQSCSGR